MNRPGFLSIAIAVPALAVWDGKSFMRRTNTHCRYCAGSRFSDFRGYEGWQVVAVSQTDDLLKVMVANPTMIDAYRAGIQR